MTSKNNKFNRKKRQSGYLTALKIILVLMTAWCQLMVFLAGAGLLYNRKSYGSDMALTGIFFIISGTLMTAGAILCLFRKNITSVLSGAFSALGLVICLVMLGKLVSHADSAGWSDNYTMQPVSGMYRRRIFPVTVPAVLTVIISAVQYFSYELSAERKAKRKSAENTPAPSIVDDDT